jgi:hypothetical protein
MAISKNAEEANNRAGSGYGCGAGYGAGAGKTEGGLC